MSSKYVKHLFMVAGNSCSTKLRWCRCFLLDPWWHWCGDCVCLVLHKMPSCLSKFGNSNLRPGGIAQNEPKQDPQSIWLQMVMCYHWYSLVLHLKILVAGTWNYPHCLPGRHTGTILEVKEWFVIYYHIHVNIIIYIYIYHINSY